MATIGELFVNLNADTSNFDKGMSQAQGKASSFGNVVKDVGKNIASFMIYDVGKKLVDGFVNATKAGINYNASLETSAIKWETLLGTQDKANKMLKDIEKFAATTPFEKMGVEAMATQLHNAGFKGQDLFNQLTKFGDLAGAFGVQSDSLQEMVRQYSQVKQAGLAYTEDLNILQDRGIPIYKALAEELDINTADVKKWASEGKISADIYQAALDNLAKGVEGGMAKQSQSFEGLKSTVKDTFDQITGILSKPIFEFLKEQLQNVLPLLESITTSLSENGLMGTIQKFAPGIQPFIESAMSIFKTMGETVGQIVQSMTDFWNEHSSWLMPLISFVWTFICEFISNTIQAIGNVVESGLNIIDGVINFFQNLFKGNFEGCWESIKQIFSNAIKFVWNYMQVNFAAKLGSMFTDLKGKLPELIKGAWNSIKTFFSQGVSNCINFVKNLLSNATSNFGTLKTFGASTFQALWSVAKTMMSNLLNAVRSSISQVPNTIRNFMNQAVGVIRGINLVSIGKSMIQGLINGIKSMGSTVVGAIKGVVSGAVNAAKKALGINSPSKVFAQFGKWTGEGLAIGINQENNRVTKASRGLANSVIDGYDANLNGIKINTSSSTIKSNNNTNSNIVVKTILDGKVIAETIASYSDVVSGNRMNLAERGLAL